MKSQNAQAICTRSWESVNRTVWSTNYYLTIVIMNWSNATHWKNQTCLLHFTTKIYKMDISYLVHSVVKKQVSVCLYTLATLSFSTWICLHNFIAWYFLCEICRRFRKEIRFAHSTFTEITLYISISNNQIHSGWWWNDVMFFYSDILSKLVASS